MIPTLLKRSLFTRLFSVETSANLKPTVTSGALLQTTSIDLPKNERIPVPLIPRMNPFLKPVPAFLRNFKTFQPESILSISPHIFNAPLRKDIMHRVVVWHRAALRQGTASSKARGEVAGSNRKIRAQKGSGKARAGSSRAPQRRGGGRCFGPKPRDHYFSLPPKIRALGLRSALTAKYRQGQLTFIKEESLDLPSHKTAELVSILKSIPNSKKLLLLDSAPLPENIRLASQSLDGQFNFLNVKETNVNVYHVLDCSCLVITPRALSFLQDWLEKGL
jgi:large subunit ribosomal protein L4